MRTQGRILTALSGVTVLLLVLAGRGTVCAQERTGIGLRVFGFMCEFHAPVGRGLLDGLAVSDGTRVRIATYWIEPGVFRESPLFLRYSDLLFATETVHYWIQGMPQPGTFRLLAAPGDSLLPEQKSAEAVLRSALGIANCIRRQRESGGTPLEVGRFFQESRAREEYSYKVLPEESDCNDLSAGTGNDAWVLNALPYGRQYSKETRSDGTLVWSVRKTVNGQPVVRVTITPRMNAPTDCPGIFDPSTLGQWTLVPEAYRMYWSFDRAYGELIASPERVILSRGLYDRVESYLRDSNVPPQLHWGLDRLRLKTALMTDEGDRVCRSARASVEELCKDESRDVYQRLVDLVGISGQIEEHYPEQAREWLRPLLEQAVRHIDPSIPSVLDKLMLTVEANKWFLSGKLLLEEVRREGLIKEDAIGALLAKLEAMRKIRSRRPVDPCELSPTVGRYLTQLNADPPRGRIDMNDVHHILEAGLAKCYPDDTSAAKRQVVGSVIGSIRLIVGEGPFCADPMTLTESVEHFSRLYLVVDQATEPIDTVLSTFLALSFCDISTPADHELLFSQFHKCCADVQSQVNAMLNDQGLGSLATPEDVNRVVQLYERIFRRYVDDPLWPAFKFPWTMNEQTRLAGRLRLRLMQLTAFLEDISLKVKYGGADPELKRKTMLEISRAAQQLLPEAAFLRSPPYPGISCRYHGGYGFSVAIKGPLYQEGNRPKERFRAMKYFHLGHRLEEVVLRERELTVPSQRQETNNEAATSEHVELPSQDN